MAGLSLGRSVGSCTWPLLQSFTRSITTSPATLAGGKWRLMQNEGICGNEYGPLAETPDWSYADGRLAPLRPGHVRKRQAQKDMCERIEKLMGELQFAKENYSTKIREQANVKQKVLDSKLQPKVSS